MFPSPLCRRRRCFCFGAAEEGARQGRRSGDGGRKQCRRDGEEDGRREGKPNLAATEAEAGKGARMHERGGRGGLTGTCVARIVLCTHDSLGRAGLGGELQD